ncbi:MAG TPA: hypothetical protein VGW78_00955 [Candidatus Babeliales bacterium]|jgi:hypothetical protein|nr:hypothetical protein [Candidatus Babeliales bacterium]
MSQAKFILINGKVICPRCDGNGIIYRATLLPSSEKIFICDECEAIWLNTDINKSNFKDFTTHIRSLGYSYNQVELSNINYDWYKTSDKTS